MERINVVGNSGSGKSTLAAQLGEKLNCPHHELDALHWKPNWTPAEPEALRAEVAALVGGPRWVVDGNYADLVRDLVWQRADTVIWLDYSLTRCLARLLRRTWQRQGQLLWGNNREDWRSVLFSWDSLFFFTIRVHYARRRQNFKDLYLDHPQLKVLRFRHPGETQRWLGELPRVGGNR